MTNINQTPKDVPIFLTPRKLADEMGLPMGGLRHWLFFRESNGLGSAVYQVGRKLLIEKQAFLDWIASHNSANGAS